MVGILSFSVGILRLFGYNLPDIFNYMFLASSFSDLFRRINIYWKSFLMKICYYPSYFKLRKIFPNNALVLSALITFFFTWFFHIYQWIWITGSNPIRLTSILYWGIFGTLATMSMLLENKKAKISKTFKGCLIHAAKVVAVFLSIALLYSMWTNTTLEEWWAIIRIAFYDDWISWIKLATYILLAILAVGTGFYIYHNYLLGYQLSLQKARIFLPYASIISLYIVFFFILQEKKHNPKVKAFVSGKILNKNDVKENYEGYYEDILKVDISSQLCHSLNIQPILANYPSINKNNLFTKFEGFVKEVGFDIIDMHDVFKEYSAKEMVVSISDGHPNPLAHRLLADRFYKELVDYLDLTKDKHDKN